MSDQRITKFMCAISGCTELARFEVFPENRAGHRLWTVICDTHCETFRKLGYKPDRLYDDAIEELNKLGYQEWKP